MIDIIIPCYNAKNTLFDTLLSVLYQTFTDFKVYLINDHSTCNYKEEVEFFSKFFYIEEIDLKKNHGPGYARNRGIERSNSPYFIFLDSDDFLNSPYSLEIMYNAMNNNGYDLLTGKYKTKIDIKGDFFVPGYSFAVVAAKAYRRSFIEEHKLKINEKLIGGEDGSYNQLIIMCGAKIGYMEDITYIYNFDNTNSITRKNNREYFAQRKPENTFIMNQLWASIQAHKRGTDVKDFLIYLIVWTIHAYSSDYSYLLSTPELKECMKDYYKYVKKLNITEEDILKEISKQFESRGKDEILFIANKMLENYKKYLGEVK